MLHILFPQIADRLKAQVPSLGTVDLDQAQLDTLTDDYPIAYPAVYIDLEELLMGSVLEGVQRGVATLRITFACQITEDTYAGQSDDQRAAAMARLELMQQVHKALHNWGGDGFGPLMRTDVRRDRPQHPEAWCMAMAYVCDVEDADGQPELLALTNADLVMTSGTRPSTTFDQQQPYVVA